MSSPGRPASYHHFKTFTDDPYQVGRLYAVMHDNDWYIAEWDGEKFALDEDHWFGTEPVLYEVGDTQMVVLLPQYEDINRGRRMPDD